MNRRTGSDPPKIDPDIFTFKPVIMNKEKYPGGYWYALAILICFILWMISFTGIAIQSALFSWNGPEDFVAHYHAGSRFFHNMAYVAMLLSGPLWYLLSASFDSTKGKDLGLAFAILVSIHYFIQLGPVRFNLEAGTTAELQHYLQANPHSVITGVLMLGWTLFLGLSSLFLYGSLRGQPGARLLRTGFILNGIFCFGAGTGYLLQVDALTFICANTGTGGSMLLIALTSMRYFQDARTQIA